MNLHSALNCICRNGFEFFSNYFTLLFCNKSELYVLNEQADNCVQAKKSFASWITILLAFIAWSAIRFVVPPGRRRDPSYGPPRSSTSMPLYLQICNEIKYGSISVLASRTVSPKMQIFRLRVNLYDFLTYLSYKCDYS